MTQPLSREEAVEKLRDLIKDIRIAMLTTVDEYGMLRSRPMATQEVEFDGDLWFFTKDWSPKVEQVERDWKVNVAYASPGDNRYVSVSGVATMSRDPGKMEELWTPALKAFFPEGLDDPDICLIKVEVRQAEYWDAPASKVVTVVGFVKSLVTGQPYRPGENEKLDLEESA